ncbi:unnamed protein product [Knipowitschia caucasica]|uniref:Saposin B-type domain-containing protein n=1 Tax=Knipowitschia caucasica TaxID=637954 RepID=A0AAV2JFK6_KNICA
MARSSLVVLCVLLSYSAWIVKGKCVEIDNEEPNEKELLALAKIPGVCWACKWAMNKVKKMVGKNASKEDFKAKLLSVCDQIGLIKSLCRKFVNKHLGVLIEELSTNDDVRTICVNTKACRPKALQMDGLYLDYDTDWFNGNDMEE